MVVVVVMVVAVATTCGALEVALGSAWGERAVLAVVVVAAAAAAAAALSTIATKII